MTRYTAYSSPSLSGRCFHPATHGSLLHPDRLVLLPWAQVVAFIRQRTDLYRVSGQRRGDTLGNRRCFHPATHGSLPGSFQSLRLLDRTSLLSSGNARISTQPSRASSSADPSSRCFHPATHGSLPECEIAEQTGRPLLMVVAFIRQRTDLYYPWRCESGDSQICRCFHPATHGSLPRSCWRSAAASSYCRCFHPATHGSLPQREKSRAHESYRRCFHPATHGSLRGMVFEFYCGRTSGLVVAFIRQRTDLYPLLRSRTRCPHSDGRCFHPATHGSLQVVADTYGTQNFMSLLSSGNARISTCLAARGRPQSKAEIVVAFIRQRTDLYHNGKSHEHTNPIVVAFIRQRTDLYTPAGTR